MLTFFFDLQDKCGGKSTKACASPDYNIATGAAYFKSQLDDAGGNFLQALGAYNVSRFVVVPFAPRD